LRCFTVRQRIEHPVLVGSIGNCSGQAPSPARLSALLHFIVDTSIVSNLMVGPVQKFRFLLWITGRESKRSELVDRILTMYRRGGRWRCGPGRPRPRRPGTAPRRAWRPPAPCC
jgi:hypothetical protein